MNPNIKKLLLTTFMVLSAVVLSFAQITYKKTVRTEGEDVSITELAVNVRPYDNFSTHRTRILAKNGVEFAITFPESYQNLSIVRNDTNILVVGRKIKVIEPGHLSFEFTYTENGVSYICDILGDVNYYGELESNGKSIPKTIYVVRDGKTMISGEQSESMKLEVSDRFPGVWWGFPVSGLDTQTPTLEKLEEFEKTIFSDKKQISFGELLEIGRQKGKLQNRQLDIVVEFGDSSSNTLPNWVPGGTSLQAITLVDARTYKVNLSQEGQGTISVAKNEFTAGESVALTAQAAQGWQFDHWEENGQHIGTANPLTFTMEAQHRTIKAVFIQIPKYTVTLQIVDTKGAILARSQQQRVQSGGSTTFQVPNLPNTNFKGWYHNGQLVGTENTYSLSNITQDETIQAVFEIPVQTIALSVTELSLKVGERGELPAVTITPDNASDKSISWASDNEAIAKIEDGSVVGVRSGTTQLIASSVNGKTAVLKVVVSEVQQYTVTLQIVDTKGTILARSQQQRVQSGGSTTFQVPNVANTNFKGWYHNGQLVGTGNTYSLSNITQDETIQAVFEIPVQTVALSVTELSLKVGERGELPTATVTPDNASDKSIRWTSDNEAIAKIEDGSVVAVSSGTTQLIASSVNGKTAVLKVVVSEVQKYTITLQIVDTKGTILARSQQQRVVSGGSTTFQVPNLPNTNFKGWYHNGQLVGTENTYSLSNITQDETIQAVFEIPVQTVALSFTEVSLKVGERGELPTATVTPDNASDKTISWASDNEAVAKIEDGSVVAVSSGTTQLIASSVNGKTAALQVVVSEVQKYTITLQIVDTKGTILARSQQQRVVSGGSTTFQVPNLPNTNFKGWYHNGQLVGTENTYSLSNITQDETIQAVFEIPIQTIALSVTELSLKVGERGELPTATVTPDNASDKSIRWTSDNEAVAKIEDGSVVGVRSGTTQLIASSVNGKTAVLKVVVSEVQKYTVTLQIVDTKGAILARSQQQRVESGGSTTFQVPNVPNTNFKGWYHNGQLVGTENTYSLSNITQDETIQAVFEIPVQTVTLSFTELSLKVGERGELPTATVTPDNASDKSIRWASDNEAVAKIEDGSVVGVHSGTTQLIASSVNGKTAALQVVVSEVQQPQEPQQPQVIPVQSVTVTPASITAKEGDAPLQLTATVLPANATSPTVSWQSANEQVVKVDNNGKVTIIGAGETTIEAKAGEKTFTVQVKVAAQAPIAPPAEEFPPYIKDFPTEITQGMAINIGQWEFLGDINASQIRYHFTDATGKVLGVAPATLQANSLTFTQSGTFVLVATLPANTTGWTEVRFSITVKIKN